MAHNQYVDGSVPWRGRYGGLGLSLVVTPRKSGGLSRTWAQAVSPNGRKTSLGLGSYPVITLAMAREKALANARAIAEGRDPIAQDDSGTTPLHVAAEKRHAKATAALIVAATRTGRKERCLIHPPKHGT